MDDVEVEVLFDAVAAGMTCGCDRRAILPVNSSAGLWVPNVTWPSHGYPDIEVRRLCAIAPAAVLPLSSSAIRDDRLTVEPSKISDVGVVAPKASAGLTAGGDEVAWGSTSGRWGQEAEAESDSRGRLRPVNVAAVVVVGRLLGSFAAVAGGGFGDGVGPSIRRLGVVGCVVGDGLLVVVVAVAWIVEGITACGSVGLGRVMGKMIEGEVWEKA